MVCLWGALHHDQHRRRGHRIFAAPAGRRGPGPGPAGPPRTRAASASGPARAQPAESARPGMTCIVGLVAADGRVHLGGDSAGIAGYDLTVRKDPKVFRVGEFAVGFTSSFRMGQLLRFAFTPPPIEGDLDAYMVTTFVNALRDCF